MLKRIEHMPVTVFLHFQKSNNDKDDISSCKIYLEAIFEIMPVIGQTVCLEEHELIELSESEIDKDYWEVLDYYPRYCNYSGDCSICYDNLQEMKNAGLDIKKEWGNGDVTSFLYQAFDGCGKTPYISDVMEWRKHDDDVYYPHILVKLKELNGTEK